MLFHLSFNELLFTNKHLVKCTKIKLSSNHAICKIRQNLSCFCLFLPMANCLNAKAYIIQYLLNYSSHILCNISSKTSKVFLAPIKTCLSFTCTCQVNLDKNVCNRRLV